MKASISSADSVDTISCIFAYKELSIYSMKTLKLNYWKQRLKLVRQTNLPPSNSGDNVSAAHKRWTDRLQIEPCATIAFLRGS